jgi:hypothetical protein
MTESLAAGDYNFESMTPDKQSALKDNVWLKHALTEVNLSRAQKSGRDNSASPTDLLIEAGHSLAYQGGQAWVTSLGQLVDDATGSGTKFSDMVSVLPRPQDAEYKSNRWYAQQIGAGIGFAAPFALTHGALKSSGLTLAARTEQSIASTGRLFSSANGIRLADGAITGFVADFTLRPLEGHEGNHLVARTKNGIIGATVMSSMTAGSLGLRTASRSFAAAIAGEGATKQTGRMIYDGSIGALSGIPGGATSAHAHSLLNEGRLASSEEVAKSIYTTAWTGGVLSAGHVIGRDPKVLSPAPPKEFEMRGLNKYRFNKRETILEKTLGAIGDAHANAKYAVHDGVESARGRAYSFLNKYDLRHPVQRARQFLRTPEVEQPRAPLTKENNPVEAFERELPRYIKEIEAKELQMESTKDRSESYERFKEMRDIRTNFAARMLDMWNGTETSPGIRQLTDAQLTTADIPVERVAEIRAAFTKPARGDSYSSTSPLTQALLKLYGKETDANYQHLDVLGEIEYAKQKHYGFSVDEMVKRMQMPRNHAIKDHEGDTPVDWMPNRRNPDNADFYHGTVSGSLSSIMTERTLLPPGELRLRGIKQTTGESANENLHRKNVSITRDFNEAYAYHRHSPASLTDFPVIYGISRDIAPRSRLAGMLERGELLVPKLGLGDNTAVKLGLKTRDITHMFVPDPEVPTVQRMLRNYGIGGVDVVGFGNMKKPEWLPDAAPIYDEHGFRVIDQTPENLGKAAAQAF